MRDGLAHPLLAPELQQTLGSLASKRGERRGAAERAAAACYQLRVVWWSARLLWAELNTLLLQVSPVSLRAHPLLVSHARASTDAVRALRACRPPRLPPASTGPNLAETGTDASEAAVRRSFDALRARLSAGEVVLSDGAARTLAADFLGAMPSERLGARVIQRLWRGRGPRLQLRRAVSAATCLQRATLQWRASLRSREAELAKRAASRLAAAARRWLRHLHAARRQDVPPREAATPRETSAPREAATPRETYSAPREAATPRGAAVPPADRSARAETRSPRADVAAVDERYARMQGGCPRRPPQTQWRPCREQRQAPRPRSAANGRASAPAGPTTRPLATPVRPRWR